MRLLTANDVILTTTCPDCKGIGSVRGTGSIGGLPGHEWFWCENCDGTGRVLKPEAAARKRLRNIALVALTLAGVGAWLLFHWRAF